MDSVLTYMVDEDLGLTEEFIRNFKKIYNISNVDLLRTNADSLRLILQSIEKEGKDEIIISALSPYYFYDIIHEFGLKPVVIDVSLDLGVPSIENITEAITNNTLLIINVFNYTHYSYDFSASSIEVPFIDIMLNGLGLDKNGDLILSNANYTIVSLESENIINSFGGSILLYNIENPFIKDTLSRREDLLLPNLNVSFVNSLLSDISLLFERKKTVLEVYKNSILKSGYYTFDNNDSNSYNYFPVIVSKSLKDIQAYCKSNNLLTFKGFEISIIKKIKGLKCPNAKSLCSRTLLVPLSFTIKKDTIELISKILSTLP